jgi:outer membrane immunogenic protein
MRHMTLAALAALSLGTVNGAMAADMPVKARPIVAPAFTWDGCYAGINGGWIRSRTSYDTRPSGSYLTTASVLAPPNAGGTGLLLGDFTSAVHSYAASDSGATVGGQVGCNKQYTWFLIGLEADINWSSADASVTAAYAPFPSANPAFTISQSAEAVSTRMDWFSTIRARGGVTFDRWLVFATGGLAIAEFKSSTNITYLANGTSPVFANASHIGQNSQTRLGAAVGGGVEYAWDNNWSVKAEYLHLEFGSWSYVSPLVAPAAAIGAGYSWTTTVRPREDMVRVGVNYRFWR